MTYCTRAWQLSGAAPPLLWSVEVLVVALVVQH